MWKPGNNTIFFLDNGWISNVVWCLTGSWRTSIFFYIHGVNNIFTSTSISVSVARCSLTTDANNAEIYIWNWCTHYCTPDWPEFDDIIIPDVAEPRLILPSYFSHMHHAVIPETQPHGSAAIIKWLSTMIKKHMFSTLNHWVHNHWPSSTIHSHISNHPPNATGCSAAAGAAEAAKVGSCSSSCSYQDPASGNK